VPATGRPDPDPYLTRLRVRGVDVDQSQHLGGAVPIELHRLHDPPFWWLGSVTFSGPEEHLDGAPLVHGPVAAGHILQRQFQVEHPPWMQGVGQDVVQQGR
jgi:hypothetical protein